MSPNPHYSSALRQALGLAPVPTPTKTRADGEDVSQPESRLGREIQKACKARGAFAFKIHGGPTMMVGLPDQIMCYRGTFIGMEVKMPGNKPTAIQLRRIEEIQTAGGVAGVVRSVSDAMALLDEVDEVTLDSDDVLGPAL